MSLVVGNAYSSVDWAASDGIRDLLLVIQNCNSSKLSLSEFDTVDSFTLVIMLVDPEVWKLSRNYPTWGSAFDDGIL